jgi:diamine N-acetyltransferase
MRTGLRLNPVTQDNVRSACKLELRADQDHLVAPVAWSLADAYSVHDIAWPRLIYDQDQLVGFIMAAFATGHENPLFHSHLWRLNIGAAHQGKGYGRFAGRRAMPGSHETRTPPADGWLPPGPQAARKFYTSAWASGQPVSTTKARR